MAQKPVGKSGKPQQKPDGLATPTMEVAQPKKLSITDFRVQAFFLAIVGFIFYCNTFGNGFAFDDKIVITQNDYVQEGFSGIPKILGTESYESFSKQQKIGNPLTGGRYRPLSIVSFAIEQQFLGVADNDVPEHTKNTPEYYKAKQSKLVSDMYLRHVDNVLFYILTVIVLLYFLRYVVFPESPWAAFFAALIFLIHPIHTEVVANVKSRDEIFSLLFILLTLISTFKLFDTRKKKHLVYALGSFFLALLSKEYGVTLMVLLPIAIWVYRKGTTWVQLKPMAWFLIPLAVYFLMRIKSVSGTYEGAEEEIMNNPYLFATPVQALASKLAVLAEYIKLLLYPHPLSADYTYNQIPYTDFSNPKVWLSIIVHLGLVAAMVYGLTKRHASAFVIAFYLGFLALVCNILVNVGAPMGERFVFHSSVALAIGLAFALDRLRTKLAGNVGNIAVGGILMVALILSAMTTIARNRDWNSDATLFLKDVETVPNSIIANCNAGAACLDHAEGEQTEAGKTPWLERGIGYETKAIAKHKRYMLAYINRGIMYFKLNDIDHALSDCDSVNKYFPLHPSLKYLSYSLADHFFKLGLESGRGGRPDEAIGYFRKGLEAMPSDGDLWYNLGYALYTKNELDEAKRAFTNALRLNPKHPQARNMLNQLTHK